MLPLLCLLDTVMSIYHVWVGACSEALIVGTSKLR